MKKAGMILAGGLLCSLLAMAADNTGYANFNQHNFVNDRTGTYVFHSSVRHESTSFITGTFFLLPPHGMS